MTDESPALSYCGIPVSFPYPTVHKSQQAIIANAILAYRNHANALLESPQALAKRLHFLLRRWPTSTPSLSRAALPNQKMVTPFLPPGCATWMHSQLANLVAEFKRFPYDRERRFSVTAGIV
jgi:hypothetical protein